MVAEQKDLTALFDDPEVLTDALTRGVQAALEEHKLTRNEVVVWREGKVVTLPSDAIPLKIEERSARE